MTPVEAATAGAEGRRFPSRRVAVGTPRGKVEQKIPYGGKTVPLVQQVPVEPKTLKAVAAAGGGHFYQAQLGGAARARSTRTSATGSSTRKQFREVTVVVTLVAFIVILAGAALSALWFRRLV